MSKENSSHVTAKTSSTQLAEPRKADRLNFYTHLGKLGSVAGTVIQANGRLTFEDDLRSGGLLCFISMNASICTELANSMVTLEEPWGD